MSNINTQQNSAAHHCKGFSLIELMVSLSVFSIIMVTSIGTLLTIVDANAKAQALYSATTNLSFALESVTREIRMGYNYYCFNSDNSTTQTLPTSPTTMDCATGRNAVGFYRERDDVHVGYRLNTDSNRIEQKVGNDNWKIMTSPDVTITEFSLEVNNSEPYYQSRSDDDQPTIDMKVVGYVQNGLETDTDFNIQSRIIQRRLDLR